MTFGVARAAGDVEQRTPDPPDHRPRDPQEYDCLGEVLRAEAHAEVTTAPSAPSLVDANGNGRLCRIPAHDEHAGASARRLDRDRELLNRLAERADLHLGATDVLRLVVVGSPLAGLAVDDQGPAITSGDGPERVRPARNANGADDEIAIGAKVRRFVRAGTPERVVGDEAAEDLTAALRRPSVVDNQMRRPDALRRSIARRQYARRASLRERNARQKRERRDDERA